MATIVRKKAPAPQPDGKTIYSLDQLPVGALGSLYLTPDEKPITFTVSGKSWAGVVVRMDQGAHRVQPGGPDTPSFLARRTKTEQWSGATCVLYLEAPQQDESPSSLFHRAIHPGSGSGRTISLRARDQSNREAVIPSDDTGDEEMVKMISGKKNKFEEAAATKKATKKTNGGAGAPTPVAAKASGNAKVAKPKAEPELKDCKCGCGESTQRTFRPGHDARYYGWLKKVAEGRMEYQELNRHVRAYLPDLASVKRASSEHWGARA